LHFAPDVNRADCGSPYVQILSLSYDSNIVASIHNDMIEIGKNLIQSLVSN